MENNGLTYPIFADADVWGREIPFRGSRQVGKSLRPTYYCESGDVDKRDGYCDGYAFGQIRSTQPTSC